MSGRPVRVLLDASAIIAFSRESLDVGEVIAEVDEEGAAVGLPVLCLVEASRAVQDRDRLTLLVQHQASTVLGNAPEDWRALAAMLDIIGRLDAASAAVAAVDFDVSVLTGQPGLYGGMAGGGPVIGIPKAP
jgi:hypothetical protein